MSKIFNLIIFQTILSFILSQGCKENENFCKKCDTLNNLCEKCDNYALVPDKNGGCIGAKKCYIGRNYCDECDEENKICVKCETGYYPDENGACSYINNCEISFNGYCLKCIDDYILIGKSNGFKICKSIYSKDLKNCKFIEEETGFCKTCEYGYYLNNGDKKCLKTENCYESYYGLCSKCNPGYYLDKKEEKCILQENQFYHCQETLDGKTCDKCEENYYFDNLGNCVSTNFCAKSENFKCIECKSNYYLTENGESCSNENNCFSADSESGFCNWCKFNYYLRYSDKKCISYDENIEYKNCKIFLSDNCIECESGYSLSEDNKCSLTQNCSETYKGECKRCSQGYYLGIDKKCTKFKHCLKSNLYYDCIECEEGFHWNIYNHTCEEWGQKFIGCKLLDISGEICSSCKDDYYLNETDNLCYSNLEQNKYYKCARIIGDNCIRCNPHYYFGKEDYKCSKIFNCQKSTNENICEKCEEDYCLDLKKMSCENNKEISDESDKKYFRCVRTNEEGTKCAECQKGFILSENGLCLNEEDCIEKEDNICVYCQNKRYPWRATCLNKIYGCVDTKDENCYRCDDIYDFNTCTECFEGYEVNNEGKCIHKF